jgi:predicted nucleotidyltransferase/uncharacterized protein with HEPN domain
MAPEAVLPRGEMILLRLNQVYPVMKKLFGIKQAGLFGATARGEPTEGPAEILVGFRQGQETYHNFIGLATYLEELLGQPVIIVTTAMLENYRMETGDPAEMNPDHALLRILYGECMFLRVQRATLTRAHLQRDELARHAIGMSFLKIAWVSARISASLKENARGVPWLDAAALARLVDGQYGTDWGIAWNALETVIPALETGVAVFLDTESRRDSGKVEKKDEG